MTQGSLCQGRNRCASGRRPQSHCLAPRMLTVHHALHDLPLGLLRQGAHNALFSSTDALSCCSAIDARSQHELPHLHRGAALLQLQHELDARSSAFHAHGQPGENIGKYSSQACRLPGCGPVMTGVLCRNLIRPVGGRSNAQVGRRASSLAQEQGLAPHHILMALS